MTTEGWKPPDPGVWRELRDESYWHYPVMEYELQSRPSPEGGIVFLLVRVARPDDPSRDSTSVGLALLPSHARQLGLDLLAEVEASPPQSP